MHALLHEGMLDVLQAAEFISIKDLMQKVVETVPGYLQSYLDLQPRQPEVSIMPKQACEDLAPDLTCKTQQLQISSYCKVNPLLSHLVAEVLLPRLTRMPAVKSSQSQELSVKAASGPVS